MAHFPIFTATGDNPAEDITTEVENRVPDEIGDLISDAGPYMGLVLGAALSAVIAFVVTLISAMILKQVFRRSQAVKRAVSRTQLPLFLVLLFAGSAVSVNYAVPDGVYWWRSLLYVALLVALIVSIAWWALRLVKIVETVVLSKYITEGAPSVEDRRGRRVQTQVSLIGRILAAVIITLAVAAVLLLNESVRGLGAGLLASAGVVSVVAGMAMQSTLTNVIAGIQLAFTDSIRVGDVVIIEDNFGTVEEITLSTVVVKSWDGRRFVYPSAYFVATPFENWTRTGTALMGTVEIPVDYRVPMGPLRTCLKDVLESSELWDGEANSLQVTEAAQGSITVRAVVSAADSGALWDLRCAVREKLIAFLAAEYPEALALQRVLLTDGEGESTLPEVSTAADVPTASAQDSEAQADGAEASLFTGSITAIQRGRDLSGPGEGAYQERRERGTEDTDALDIVEPAEADPDGTEDAGDTDSTGDPRA